MKKIIRITESDLTKIVKEVLTEQQIQYERISKIQKALKKAGLKYEKLLGNTGPNKDGVDGIYGKRTKKAVEEFQKDNGIKSTGFVGKITSKALGLDGVRQEVDQKKKKKDTTLSSNIDIPFKDKFIIDKLNSQDSTYVCKAGQEECGQFVNDFSKKLEYVGNAWLAHDTDKVGQRIFSSYTSLNPEQVKKIFEIFKKIERKGGPQEKGTLSTEIKNLQNQVLKDVSPDMLKVDDVVGIYYPPSSHHEEAFYEAGKPYFIKDINGNLMMGDTIKKGKGFGMNTHVGIVGAIKDGVPLVFHNIKGNVFSDPYDKLKDGGKIAWVKRS